MTRQRIPAEVSRQVLLESGHRCAVCGAPCPLERAHIIPFCDSQDNALENLICLCANCHERASEESWGERTLREYKLYPWVKRKYTDNAAAQPKMTRVEISIDVKYEDFDQRSKNLLKHALAGFLGIPPEYVKLESVRKGSVQIVVLLPDVESERLTRAYEMKDVTLAEQLTPFSLLGMHREMESRERLLPQRAAPDHTSGQSALKSGDSSSLDFFQDDFLSDNTGAISVTSVRDRLPAVDVRGVTVINAGAVHTKAPRIIACPRCGNMLKEGMTVLRFKLAPEPTRAQHVEGWVCDCGEAYVPGVAAKAAHGRAFVGAPRVGDHLS